MRDSDPLPARAPVALPDGLQGSVEEALAEALLAERERSAFLADASRALAGSLNVDRLALRVLRVAVPRLGRAAAVCFSGPAGRTWALQHADAVPAAVPDLPSGFPGHLVAEAVATDRVRGEGGGLALPLVARGTPFGALLLVADQPYDESELLLAEDYAQRAALALDAARVYGDRNHVAKVLEANLRPPQLPVMRGVRIATGYRPAAESDGLGGDFYDVHGQDGDWSVVLGDVCGKGVEAAVVTGRARESIRTAAHVDRSPAAVLALLNRTLLDVPDAPFVTLVCARLRPQPEGSVRVELANAGHPAALVIRRGAGVQQVHADGMIAGVEHGVAYVEAALTLAPGDVCLLYTDGVIEARRAGQMFGLRRLLEAAQAIGAVHPQAVVDSVLEGVLKHLGGEPHDDIALLAFQADPEAGA